MAKPTDLPIWATDGGADVVEPPTAKKELGWVSSERPPAQYFNWYMELTHDWIEYLSNLDTETAFLGADYAWTGSHTFSNATAITLLASSSLVVGANADIEVNTDGCINLNAGGDLHVKTGGQILVEDGGEVAVLANGRLEVRASGVADIEASATLNVGGTVNVESGGSIVATSGSTVELSSGSIIDVDESPILDNSTEILYGSAGSAAARTVTTAVPILAHSVDDTVGGWTFGISGGFSVLQTNAADAAIAFPLYLPDGAVINSITAVIQQASSQTQNLTLSLRKRETRSDSTTAFDTQVATITTGVGFGSLQSITATPGATETVSNTVGTAGDPFVQYYLRITGPDPGSASDIRSIYVNWDDPGPRNY